MTDLPRGVRVRFLHVRTAQAVAPDVVRGESQNARRLDSVDRGADAGQVRQHGRPWPLQRTATASILVSPNHGWSPAG